jgi:hypothetical protein
MGFMTDRSLVCLQLRMMTLSREPRPQVSDWPGCRQQRLHTRAVMYTPPADIPRPCVHSAVVVEARSMRFGILQHCTRGL